MKGIFWYLASRFLTLHDLQVLASRFLNLVQVKIWCWRCLMCYSKKILTPFDQMLNGVKLNDKGMSDKREVMCTFVMNDTFHAISAMAVWPKQKAIWMSLAAYT